MIRVLRRKWLFAALVGTALISILGLLGSGAPEDPDHSGPTLEARADALRAATQLARADRNFFVLDPGLGALTLYAGGAELRVYPVGEVRAGSRRAITWGVAEGADDWRTRVWADARIDPPIHRNLRVIVSDSVVAPDLAGAEKWIPPTPEEGVPAPRHFMVHFADGLGVEFALAEGEEAPRDIKAQLRGLLARMLPRNWDRHRIRVEMTAVELAALYRAFPLDAAFVAVLPKG